MLMLVAHLSQVAETLIKNVLAPPSQKTKLIEAKELIDFLYLLIFFYQSSCMLRSSIFSSQIIGALKLCTVFFVLFKLGHIYISPFEYLIRWLFNRGKCVSHCFTNLLSNGFCNFLHPSHHPRLTPAVPQRFWFTDNYHSFIKRTGDLRIRKV